MTVDRNLRRKELLTSFLNTFAKHGLDKTSMRYLIVESGISSSFIYEMFEGRDQMVIETIRFYYQSLIDVNEAMRNDANLTLVEFLLNTEELAIKNLMYDRFVTQSILHPGYRPRVFDLVETLIEVQQALITEKAEKEGIKTEYAKVTLDYLYSALNSYAIMMDKEIFRTQMERLRKFWLQLQQGEEPKPTWQI
ncbi:MAG: TetR/AcrR family transcriptional regulator [Rikenellaceae bacterium]|nr:TetR/AcrR family transcriptional regulator [Rikenellaceae bacterium]